MTKQIKIAISTVAIVLLLAGGTIATMYPEMLTGLLRLKTREEPTIKVVKNREGISITNKDTRKKTFQTFKIENTKDTFEKNEEKTLKSITEAFSYIKTEVDKQIEELKKDSDSDGLTDANEEKYGTDINLKDTDGDTLNDGYEVDHKYNPLTQDSDQDGVNDDDELKFGTDPNDKNSKWDPYGDDDNDKVKNMDEKLANTDTDADGLSDYDENKHGTDSNSNDTDSDTFSDYFEVLNTFAQNLIPTNPEQIVVYPSEIKNGTQTVSIDGKELTFDYEIENCVKNSIIISNIKQFETDFNITICEDKKNENCENSPLPNYFGKKEHIGLTLRWIYFPNPFGDNYQESLAQCTSIK